MTDPVPGIVSDNFEIGAALADAMVGLDGATFQRILSPEVIWHFPGRDHAIAGDHEGFVAVATFAGKVAELTEGTFHMEVHEIYASESGAVIAFSGHGTRPDGRVLDNPTRLILRIADGRVEEVREFVWDSEAVSAFWR
jgi:ketosteroid isomerase-like protein